MTNLLARRLAIAGLGAMLAVGALAQTPPGGSTDPAAPGASMPAPSAPLSTSMPASAAPMSMPPAAIAPAAASAADTAPQTTTATPPVAAARPVTSLARVVSVHSEPASEMNVRLKLVPRMSYATQTFKVTDRSQLEGLSEGSWVRFTSKRQGGVEMLDKVEPVLECKRMAVCGSTRTLPTPSTAS